MRQIEFIKDFATKKKGDIWKCDSMLATQLVVIEKVAKYYEEKSKIEAEITGSTIGKTLGLLERAIRTAVTKPKPKKNA